MSMTTEKVALVTGASRGIGAGLVTAFVERGYRVVANSRTIESSASPDVLIIAGDIAAPETASHMAAAAVAHFGRIDTLVNNAGIFIPKPFTDYSAADFEAIMSVSIAGFFHITQHAVRQMVKQGGGGHIVNV